MPGTPGRPGAFQKFHAILVCIESGKKKQHKHKLFGPDFPRTFLTLTPECPGVKKFLPTTGAAGKRTFWCGRPRFSARTSMARRVVEKLCTKKVCVDFFVCLEKRCGGEIHDGNLVQPAFLRAFKPEDGQYRPCPAQEPGFNVDCGDGNRARWGYCANCANQERVPGMSIMWCCRVAPVA